MNTKIPRLHAGGLTFHTHDTVMEFVIAAAENLVYVQRNSALLITGVVLLSPSLLALVVKMTKTPVAKR